MKGYRLKLYQQILWYVNERMDIMLLYVTKLKKNWDADLHWYAKSLWKFNQSSIYLIAYEILKETDISFIHWICIQGALPLNFPLKKSLAWVKIPWGIDFNVERKMETMSFWNMITLTVSRLLGWNFLMAVNMAFAISAESVFLIPTSNQHTDMSKILVWLFWYL